MTLLKNMSFFLADMNAFNANVRWRKPLQVKHQLSCEPPLYNAGLFLVAMTGTMLVGHGASPLVGAA